MFKPVKLKKQIVTIESDEQDEDIDIMEEPSDEPPSSDGMGKTTQEERRYQIRATRGQMPRAFKDFELNP